MSISRIHVVEAGGVLMLSLVLAGCGGSTATRPPANSAAPSVAVASSQAPTAAVSAEHNDVDVAFAQTMIPHHQQAIEMAEIATDRAQRPEVETLAEEIRAAQGPEITQLLDFLAAWGAEAPPPGSMSGSAGGMDHGGMTGTDAPDQSGTTAMNGARMPGMMTNAQMQQLRNATGSMFDAMFLQMMIEHHRGAVSDAQREVDGGSNPRAKALAEKIVADQNAEIGRMQTLLT